jgi:hypothetical protein
VGREPPNSGSRHSLTIPNFPPELMSETPGNLLVEICKGHTPICHDNSTGFQEGKPCPTAEAALAMQAVVGTTIS